LAHSKFSLPISNGKLERVFPILKTTTDKRSSLGNETLDDLLMLNTEAVSLSQFNPDKSIDMWWKATKRCLNQLQRKNYARSHSSSISTTSSSSDSAANNEAQQTENANTSEYFQ